MPHHTAYIYQQTPAVGFVAASSIERIPVEEAVIGISRRFKGVPLSSLVPGLIKEPTSIIIGMNHIAIVVSNIQKSLEFYVNLLGCTVMDISSKMGEDTIPKGGNAHNGGKKIAFLDFFGQKLRIVETNLSLQKNENIEISLTTSDGRFAYQKFKEQGVVSSEGLLELAGGGCRFYILDPDGRKIEICQPPKGSAN
jgi:catechol 2,3-dioxygenase-like lactoylglutathione lyase family enzyme